MLAKLYMWCLLFVAVPSCAAPVMCCSCSEHQISSLRNSFGLGALCFFHVMFIFIFRIGGFALALTYQHDEALQESYRESSQGRMKEARRVMSVVIETAEALRYLRAHDPQNTERAQQVY